MKTEFDFENLTNELGNFNKFQIRNVALASVVVFIGAMSVVNTIFLAKSASHRCYIDGCPEDGSYDAPFLNFTTTRVNSMWSRCTSLARLNVTNATCSPNSFTTSEEIHCHKWIYKTDVMESTATTEFSMVCDKSWQQPLAGSCFMLGMLIGAVTIGTASDFYGRKVGLIAAITFINAGCVMSFFSTNFLVFALARVVVGTGAVAMFQSAFILVLEYASTKYRALFGILIEIPFAFGEATVALVAYFIRDWRWLEVACVVPSLFLLSYWWLVPESVRWLLANERAEEAKQTILNIAAMNRVELSANLLTSLDDQVNRKEEIKEKSTNNILHVFRYPRMRIRTVNLVFCWTVSALTYFGLSGYSAALAGNFHWNFVLIMLVEIPSYVFSYIALDRIGRKGTLCVSLLIGGLSCFAGGLLPEHFVVLRAIMSMVGKFGVAAAFAIVFVYSAELYPTECRSAGVGTCSMASRIGGFCAPFIVNLGEIYKPLPLIVFGLLATTSGLLVIGLPETTNHDLPQTLAESEEFGKNQKWVVLPFVEDKKIRKENAAISEHSKCISK